MTEQDFMANLGNIKALCSPERDASMNQIAKQNAPQNKDAFGPVNEYDYGEKWEKMFLGESTTSAPAEIRNEAPISTERASRSRMPDFIKNSMLSETIDTTKLNPNPLERMDLSKFQSKPQINEQRPAMPVPQQVTAAPAANGIDYPLLRAIISECIDSKFKELGLTKEMLTENTLKTVHLKGGQIRLVDNSGNVFGAKLELQGNVNDKKK